jgi:hypothetical protein
MEELNCDFKQDGMRFDDSVMAMEPDDRVGWQYWTVMASFAIFVAVGIWEFLVSGRFQSILMHLAYLQLMGVGIALSLYNKKKNKR